MELTVLAGQIIQAEEIKAVSGNNIRRIDLSDLRKGMYLVRLRSDSGYSAITRITLE